MRGVLVGVLRSTAQHGRRHQQRHQQESTVESCFGIPLSAAAYMSFIGAGGLSAGGAASGFELPARIWAWSIAC